MLRENKSRHKEHRKNNPRNHVLILVTKLIVILIANQFNDFCNAKSTMKVISGHSLTQDDNLYCCHLDRFTTDLVGCLVLVSF